jgi:thiamine-monophosphate kinase
MLLPPGVLIKPVNVIGISKSPGEFGFIHRLAEQAATAKEALGLDDDGAIFTSGTQKWVLVKDLVQAGIHGLADDSIDDLVRKAIRTNLSDLAAMGAKPVFYLLGLCLGETSSAADLSSLPKTLADEGAMFGIQLIGGDTVQGQGPLTISITALGQLKSEPVLRSGAKAGDDIWVSGTIGDSALGLRVLQGKTSGIPKTDQKWLTDRYHYPEPRLALGQKLAEIAHSMIDISDGLAVDAKHIANSSKVCLILNLDKTPRSTAFRAWETQNSNFSETWPILSGGDDYELLFTASKSHRKKITKIGDKTDCKVCRIGKVGVGKGLKLMFGHQLQNLPEDGFTHF